MIDVENLTKGFRDRKKGTIYAVSGVTFSCAPGEVFGLLGPNGAGKTTALRMISTALKPTAGRGSVMGFDFVRDPQHVRKSIGFLSANTGLYGRLTPREILRYFGNLFSMERRHIEGRIAELSVAFDMGDFLDRPCDKLSTGMKQKVNIARSVIHSPPVMIFDEPTTGLDVLTSRSIIEFVRQCRVEGRTVLLSTHIMTEARKLCDRVGIIHEGKMRFVGTTDDLRTSHGDDLEDAFMKIIGATP